MLITLLARGAFAACLLFLVQSPTIRFDQDRGLFLLEGWAGASQQATDRWPELLSISVDVPDVPALLGEYRIETGTLTFKPQYPLQPGLRYRAVAHVPGMGAITAAVEIPKPRVESTTLVEHIYPSTNRLPENQLKFYIHFSGPMSRGDAYSHVGLLDESGTRIDLPFLELGEELWDQEARRFTLFFDPGRIKRDLVPHNELGVPIHEGKTYTLVIDRDWLDGEGVPLAAEFRKTFTVEAADRKPLDFKQWTVRAPASGTTAAVSVEFSEPLDHAILMRELDIVDAGGIAVPGDVMIDRNEMRWQFTPDSPWKKGGYSVRVGTATADLAGNMIDRPFEVDVFEQVSERIVRETKSLPFTIN